MVKGETMTSKTKETLNKIGKCIDMLFVSAGLSNMKWSLFLWQDDPSPNAKPIGQRVNYVANVLRPEVLVSIEAVAHRWREQNIRPGEETATTTIHAFIAAAREYANGHGLIDQMDPDFQTFLAALEKVEAITAPPIQKS